MKIVGTGALGAPIMQVWPCLLDPSWLADLIPGCQQLEQTGPGEYRGEIQVGVAAVGGTYQVSARLAEQDSLRACRFEGHISGPAGGADGDVALHLKEVNGTTTLDYHMQAIMTGALASIPPHLVEGVVKTLINQSISRLNVRLKAAQAGEPQFNPSE